MSVTRRPKRGREDAEAAAKDDTIDAKLRAAGGHDAAVAAGKQCVEEASREQRAKRRRALVGPYGFLRVLCALSSH